MLKHSFSASVLDITSLSPTVKQIVLKVSSPFHFLPGQWLEVVFFDKATNATEITGFSFIDSQYTNLLNENQKITLAIKESDHPIVQYIHHQLQINDTLSIQGPDGTFTFPPQDTTLHNKTKVILIGSGIGVTPLISMIRTFVDYKIHYSKLFPNSFFDQIEHFEFVYGVKNEQEFIFAKELFSAFQQLSSLLFAKLHVCFSKQDQLQSSMFSTTTTFFEPHFATRISSTLLTQLIANIKSEKLLIYLCGPSTLVTESRHCLQTLDTNISIQYEKW